MLQEILASFIDGTPIDKLNALLDSMRHEAFRVAGFEIDGDGGRLIG